MRAAGPVIRARVPILGDVSFVTGYGDAAAMLKDPARFSTDGARVGRSGIVGMKWWMPRQFRLLTNNMMLKDDPEHRRLRKLVDQAFHRGGVEALRPRIAALTDDLLDRLAASADGDLVGHFARALPLAVICELLGLPQEDRPHFTRWMASLTEASTLWGIVRMTFGVRRLIGYLERQFELRRADPRDDLISKLVAAEEEGDRLSADELLAMCFLLFVAGHETTTHLISGGVLALLQHPGELDRLKADWSLAPAAVDELLRFVSPVQMTKPRYAVEDMTVAGVNLKRGEPMIALLASANCDPQAFSQPEKLDITRSPNRHLAFGNGPHLCLGLALAQAEGEIAVERLFTRFPDLRLAVAESELAWGPRIGMRALRRLPVAGLN
jgi:cytochrome P450